MLKIVMTTLISATFCLSALAPASALPVAPIKPAPVVSGASDALNVHYKRRGYYRHYNRHYYNGHRGFRHHRRGYRHYNGYWFPPAAFSFGIIIDQHSYRGHRVRPGFTHPRHVRYCYNRYRSYRHYDNTFQPYHGQRRQCRSRYY